MKYFEEQTANILIPLVAANEKLWLSSDLKKYHKAEYSQKFQTNFNIWMDYFLQNVILILSD